MKVKKWVLCLSLVCLLGCEPLDIDRCLDAGGRWVHEQGQCLYR